MKKIALKALAIGVLIGACGLNAQKESLALQELRAEGKVPKQIDDVSFTVPTLEKAQIEEYQSKIQKIMSDSTQKMSQLILSSNFSIRDQEDSEELFGILYALCDTNKECRDNILKPWILALCKLDEEYYPKTYIKKN